MKLWLVQTEYYTYDEFDSFVVRAESETAAREVAGQGDEYHKNFWRASKKVTVKEITVEGEPEVILGSFNAG